MQTIFGGGENNTVLGNCMQAVIASIFDLPLDAVPHFLTFGDQWHHAFRLWLKSKGMKENLWHTRWIEEEIVDISFIPEGQYVDALGLAARGLNHACVFQKKGKWFVPIHDPHPDGTFYGENKIQLVRWFDPIIEKDGE